MLICDKCNNKIDEVFKFCPHCGDPVDFNDKKTTEINQGSSYTLLTFGYSSSPSYEKAVEICKKIPTYKIQGDGKNIVHEVTIPTTEILLIVNLWEIISNWKTSKMLINGKICTKKDLAYNGIGCYRNCLNAVDKDKFCYGKQNNWEFNIWGCKKLQMPMFAYGDSWLTYGRFDKNGFWYFDKLKIKEELEERIKDIELCPILNTKRIYDALNLLPEKIDPRFDPNFEYLRRYDGYDSKTGKEIYVIEGIQARLSPTRQIFNIDYVFGDDIHDAEIVENQNKLELKPEIEKNKVTKTVNLNDWLNSKDKNNKKDNNNTDATKIIKKVLKIFGI